MKRRELFAISFILAFSAIIAALGPKSLKAQTTYGTIVGTVTDSSGAVIPDALIRISSLGTGETRTATSDLSGNFSIVNLLPANYKVETEKSNFKRSVYQSIQVAVGATVRVEVTLEVGTATESVEVTTQAPLLQTDSGTMLTQVQGTTVQEMPLNGRNSMNLLALTPGVVPQGSTSGGTGMNQGTHTNWQGWGNYQIGGSLSGTNAVYLDGAPNSTLAGNTISMILTQDAIQEFSVVSNSQTAEFGRNGGGVVNMATKGGGNTFHGSAYEYLRNSFFNSNEFFNKQSQLSTGAPNKPLQWNQHQYGLAVGGPVKKDKLFFHFTWENFFADTAKGGASQVPTANEQNGIIPLATTSHLVDTGAATFTDSQGAVHPGAGFSSCIFDTTTNPGYTTIKNLWTAGCGDPMAKIIRDYFPPPTPNYNPGTGSNFFIAPPSKDNQNQYNGRGDWVLSNKQRIFSRYTYWRLKDSGQANLGNHNGWMTQNAASASYAHQAVLGDTYTFSPTTVLDVRLSYLRHNNFDSLPGSLGTDPAKFPGTYYPTIASQMSENVLPYYGIGRPYNPPFYRPNSFYSGYWFNTYAINANLTKIKGNHNLKVGTELRLMTATNIGGGGPSVNSGVFAFDGLFTGNSWVDFLLGYISNSPNEAGQLGLTNAVTNYNRYQAYYIEDSWNATHNLTVNAGLRWELPGGLYERHSMNTVLLPSYQWTQAAGAPSPGTSVTGALALVNSSLYGDSSAINVKRNLFAPRFGMAYRIGNDMAVRAGYGISYLPIDSSGQGNGGGVPAAMAQYSPINASTTFCGSTRPTITAGGVTYYIPDSNQMMYNCFGPAGANNNAVGNPVIKPTGTSLNGGPLMTYIGALSSTGASITAGIPAQKLPYVQQWNLSISRQMPGDLMVEVGYVGSKGTHLPALGSNFNQLADSYYSQGSALLNTAYCATTGTVTTMAQCARPFPWYGNVSDAFAFNSATTYNAMQIKGEKRFHSGGTIMGNYTWSKMIGNTDSSQGSFLENNPGLAGPGGGGSGGTIQDYNNLRSERSVLQHSVPHRAVISYVLNLPFGHNQRWGSNATGVVDRVISGWGVNGITTFQKGFHLGLADTATPGVNNSLSRFGFGSLRPNYTAGCNKTQGIIGSYADRVLAGTPQFNTSCWTQPADWQPGNEPRVNPNLFAQGIDNFDLTFLKSTRITEQTNIQFRAEFFNLFNRVQFSTPATSLGQMAGPVPAFGKVFATANQPRLVQFSLRLAF